MQFFYCENACFKEFTQGVGLDRVKLGMAYTFLRKAAFLIRANEAVDHKYMT